MLEFKTAAEEAAYYEREKIQKALMGLDLDRSVSVIMRDVLVKLHGKINPASVQKYLVTELGIL